MPLSPPPLLELLEGSSSQRFEEELLEEEELEEKLLDEELPEEEPLEEGLEPPS